jgi:hypothetical protein
MSRMNAAVVTSFAEPPHYLPFDVPQPRREGDVLADVLAAGLHPRVRSGAAGAHYGRGRPAHRRSRAYGQALAAAAAETDIVLDYLWGEPAARAITALLTARSDRSRPLDWVQIGAVAGPTIELPSVALRSANVRLQGSGQGAVGAAGYVAELPPLISEITAGAILVTAEAVPLADVERAWSRPEAAGVRTVLVP